MSFSLYNKFAWLPISSYIYFFELIDNDRAIAILRHVLRSSGSVMRRFARSSSLTNVFLESILIRTQVLITVARSFLFLTLAVFVTNCGKPLALPASTTLAQQTPFTTQTVTAMTPAISVTTTQPTSIFAPTTIEPQARPSPTTVVSIQPQLRPTPTNEERWAQEQLNRQAFGEERSYVASEATTLFWFDPRTSQVVPIGTLLGSFTATATFTWRANGEEALVVPYTINQSYGLTAISEALILRMHDAGFTDQVEAFVLVSNAIQPQ